jgi:hypothetical protein
MAFQPGQPGLECLSTLAIGRTRSREAQTGRSSTIASPKLSKYRWHKLENPSEKIRNLLEHFRKMSTFDN